MYDKMFQALEEWGKANGCEFDRADEDLSGERTLQRMINNIYSADIVIADLSNSNPNVFYELALRHSIGKPVIHITNNRDTVPYDIAVYNILKKPDPTMPGNLTTVIGNAIKELRRESFLSYPAYSESPYVNPRGVLRHDGFQWSVAYEKHLYKNWLERQSEDVKDFINAYREKNSSWQDTHKDFIDNYANVFRQMESISNHETAKAITKKYASEPAFKYLTKLAEYIKYKEYSGLTCKHELFFIHNKKTDQLRGYAYFGNPKDEDGIEIKITGKRTANGLEITYKQPESLLAIPNAPSAFSVPVGKFKYNIKFGKAEPDADIYDGKFIHPDFTEGKGRKSLIIGHTSLTPIVCC
jgi:hypothetical protein